MFYLWCVCVCVCVDECVCVRVHVCVFVYRCVCGACTLYGTDISDTYGIRSCGIVVKCTWSVCYHLSVTLHIKNL